jgi:xanthine dehydrogenase YagR molybdenum-binding subunit
MTWVGKPMPRADGRAKVTGSARYSHEMAPAAHAVLVTTRSARGRAAGFETLAAEAEPGVLAVITPHNALRLPGKTSGASPDRVVQVLQDDRIWYSNQPIAVVVADTFERAVHAARLLRVAEASAPHSVVLEERLHLAFPSEILAGGRKQEPDSKVGDGEAALVSGPAAQAVIDERYDMPPQAHNPLEPHATVAAWEGDRLTVYDSSQWVFSVRNKIATAFQIPKENVRVVTKFVGGAFGSKGAAWSHVLIAALAAKQVGRPVKLALSREQMFGSVGGRPRTHMRMAAAAARDGRLLALAHHSTSSTSEFDVFVEPAALTTRHLYACPNIETSHRIVRLDIGTPTFMRAPGESTGSFALESALDELAHALAIDPLQLRLQNYAETDPSEGKPFSSKALRRCYEEAARRFGWDRRKARPRSVVRDGLLVGMGMSTASYPANFAPASALARLMPDGTAQVESGTIDIGTGTYTVMAQVAADALGLPYDKVSFDLGDSLMPEAPIAAGSMTAASVASAVLVTCRALREKLVRMAIADPASPLHGAIPDQVAVESGTLSARGRSDTYLALVERAGGEPIEERGKAEAPEARKQLSNHAFGAHFAEVLVDPDLGSVRVSRMVSAFAAGRVLNHRTAHSQLMGGMVWGIGMALHERCAYDARLGRIMNHDLADYHVPTNADVGLIEPILIEEPGDPGNPAGVKGVGELGLCGAAAAIANAVFNATGRRIRELPISPDKLVQ